MEDFEDQRYQQYDLEEGEILDDEEGEIVSNASENYTLFPDYLSHKNLSVIDVEKSRYENVYCASRDYLKENISSRVKSSIEKCQPKDLKWVLPEQKYNHPIGHQERKYKAESRNEKVSSSDSVCSCSCSSCSGTSSEDSKTRTLTDEDEASDEPLSKSSQDKIEILSTVFKVKSDEENVDIHKPSNLQSRNKQSYHGKYKNKTKNSSHKEREKNSDPKVKSSSHSKVIKRERNPRRHGARTNSSYKSENDKRDYFRKSSKRSQDLSHYAASKRRNSYQNFSKNKRGYKKSPKGLTNANKSKKSSFYEEKDLNLVSGSTSNENLKTNLVPGSIGEMLLKNKDIKTKTLCLTDSKNENLQKNDTTGDNNNCKEISELSSEQLGSEMAHQIQQEETKDDEEDELTLRYRALQSVMKGDSCPSIEAALLKLLDSSKLDLSDHYKPSNNQFSSVQTDPSNNEIPQTKDSQSLGLNEFLSLHANEMNSVNMNCGLNEYLSKHASELESVDMDISNDSFCDSNNSTEDQVVNQQKEYNEQSCRESDSTNIGNKDSYVPIPIEWAYMIPPPPQPDQPDNTINSVNSWCYNQNMYIQSMQDTVDKNDKRLTCYPINPPQVPSESSFASNFQSIYFPPPPNETSDCFNNRTVYIDNENYVSTGNTPLEVMPNTELRDNHAEQYKSFMSTVIHKNRQSLSNKKEKHRDLIRIDLTSSTKYGIQKDLPNPLTGEARPFPLKRRGRKRRKSLKKNQNDKLSKSETTPPPSLSNSECSTKENVLDEDDEDILRAKLLNDMAMKSLAGQLRHSFMDQTSKTVCDIPKARPLKKQSLPFKSQRKRWLKDKNVSKVAPLRKAVKPPTRLDIGGQCLDTKNKFKDAPTSAGFSLSNFPPVKPVIINLSQDSDDSEEESGRGAPSQLQNSEIGLISEINSFIKSFRNSHDKTRNAKPEKLMTPKLNTPKVLNHLSKERQEEYKQLRALFIAKKKTLQQRKSNRNPNTNVSTQYTKKKADTVPVNHPSDSHMKAVASPSVDQTKDSSNDSFNTSIQLTSEGHEIKSSIGTLTDNECTQPVLESSSIKLNCIEKSSVVYENNQPSILIKDEDSNCSQVNQSNSDISKVENKSNSDISKVEDKSNNTYLSNLKCNYSDGNLMKVKETSENEDNINEKLADPEVNQNEDENDIVQEETRKDFDVHYENDQVEQNLESKSLDRVPLIESEFPKVKISEHNASLECTSGDQNENVPCPPLVLDSVADNISNTHLLNSNTNEELNEAEPSRTSEIHGESADTEFRMSNESECNEENVLTDKELEDDAQSNQRSNAFPPCSDDLSSNSSDSETSSVSSSSSSSSSDDDDDDSSSESESNQVEEMNLRNRLLQKREALLQIAQSESSVKACTKLAPSSLKNLKENEKKAQNSNLEGRINPLNTGNLKDTEENQIPQTSKNASTVNKVQEEVLKMREKDFKLKNIQETSPSTHVNKKRTLQSPGRMQKPTPAFNVLSQHRLTQSPKTSKTTDESLKLLRNQRLEEFKKTHLSKRMVVNRIAVLLEEANDNEKLCQTLFTKIVKLFAEMESLFTERKEKTSSLTVNVAKTLRLIQKFGDDMQKSRQLEKQIIQSDKTFSNLTDIQNSNAKDEEQYKNFLLQTNSLKQSLRYNSTQESILLKALNKRFSIPSTSKPRGEFVSDRNAGKHFKLDNRAFKKGEADRQHFIRHSASPTKRTKVGDYSKGLVSSSPSSDRFSKSAIKAKSMEEKSCSRQEKKGTGEDLGILCPYDLLGRCNDDQCAFNHTSVGQVRANTENSICKDDKVNPKQNFINSESVKVDRPERSHLLTPTKVLSKKVLSKSDASAHDPSEIDTSLQSSNCSQEEASIPDLQDNEKTSPETSSEREISSERLQESVDESEHMNTSISSSTKSSSKKRVKRGRKAFKSKKIKTTDGRNKKLLSPAAPDSSQVSPTSAPSASSAPSEEKRVLSETPTDSVTEETSLDETSTVISRTLPNNKRPKKTSRAKKRPGTQAQQPSRPLRFSSRIRQGKKRQ